jgi:outer membrane protein assembly factor BamB
LLERGAGVRDVLIDLGEVPGGEPEPALPRGPLPYRWILGILTVVLTVVLGGGGPPPEPPPEPVVVPLTINDGIRLDGDRLYVIEQADPIGSVVRDHTIRAYGLPGVNLLNTYRVKVRGDIHQISDIGDGLLMVSYSDVQSGAPGTMVTRPGEEAPVWERPVAFYGLSPDRSLFLGYEGPGGRRSVWYGFDPRTGAVRWSMEPPVSSLLAVPLETSWSGFSERLYLLRTDGLLEALSTRTGAVTRSVRLAAPVRDHTVFWASGGLLLVGRGPDETTAYDQETLAEKWRRPGSVMPDDGYPQDCRPTICIARYGGGLQAVDPATGQRLWSAGRYDASEVIDGNVLVAQSSQAEPVLAVLDPVTGAVAARITGWVSGGPGPEPGTAWVYRLDQPGYHLQFGVLDLGDRKVRVLGRAERIAGNCQFTTTVLVCRRLDSSIAVWRL